MSYLAIGSVTKAMIQLLSRKLNKPALLPGGTFRVTTLAPDDDRVAAQNGINLYLYRIAENPHLRNMPWAGDATHPNGSRQIPLALTLQYLLTAYAQKVQNGTTDEVIAHQLLGNAMSILHDFPVLNDIHDADFDASLPAQFPTELADAFEKVKITLLPISMDEFSKIWTGFSKAFRLSVAYEVSLVQIAPLAPAIGLNPPPQRAFVRAQPIQVPIIGALDPVSGAAGSTLTILGSGFVSAGRQPTVTIGDVELVADDLASVTANELVVKVPSAFRSGPEVGVTVEVGGLISNASTFTVDPWIGRLRPLRGIVGTPIEIAFAVPSGVTPGVEIDGTAAVATVDAEQSVVRAIVPATIAANGPKSVALILPGPPLLRTNQLTYEALPSIATFTATQSGAPVKTTVAITGARLSGSDVFIRYGALSVRVDVSDPANTDTSVTADFNRALPPGGPVSVLVDGRQSNPLPRLLASIDPVEGSAGDSVTLSGAGLNGVNVSVQFGAQNVSVGSQPFANVFAVEVPAGLAAGPTKVHVTVDGSSTADVDFEVLN